MKKLILVFTVLSFFAVQSVSAQGAMRIGAEGNVVLPFGNISDFTSPVGFGATALFIYPFNENISFSGRVGWMTLGGEDLENSFLGQTSTLEYSISAIPIQGGVRYHLNGTGEPGLYVGGEVGFHILSIDTESSGVSGFEGGSTSSSETEFTIAPMVGFSLEALDMSAFINLLNDATWFGIRVGWTMPFGN
ncbi:MAG: outer membrane beta-barrel protein [Calditrichota bacterium]